MAPAASSPARGRPSSWRRAAVGLVALAAAVGVTLSPCGDEQAAVEEDVHEGYQLVFADDFDGPTLDTGVWATAPFGGSMPATVADGVLRVKATAANDHHWGYV